MPATVHLNMIKEKHKTMINGFTFKSWPLISNVLLVLTGNYISISISLPLYQWTMAYLKPPIPLPHPLLLVDDLIHPSQLQKFAEKNTNHPKRTPSIFPHISYPFESILFIFSLGTLDVLSVLLAHTNASTCAVGANPSCRLKDTAITPSFSWTMIFFSLLDHSYQQHNLLFILLC